MEQKVKNIKVINETNAQEFERQTQELLKQGWQPFGFPEHGSICDEGGKLIYSRLVMVQPDRSSNTA